MPRVIKSMFKTNMNTPEFWNYVRTMGHLDGIEIKNRTDIFQKEVNKYERRLAAADQTFATIFDGRQYYERTIFFDKGQYGYEVVWDISKVDECIQSNSVEFQSISVADVIDVVDRSNINEKRLDNVSDQPIYVIYFDPLNTPIIIDGNHRAFKAFSEDPEAKINAYVFRPDQHLSFFAGDIFRLMYKIHHNLVVLDNLVLGYIDDVNISSKNSKTSLYPL